MKIAGWIFFGLGLLMLLGAFVSYATADGAIGEAGVSLMSGLGISAIPIMLGLVLLSKAEKRG